MSNDPLQNPYAPPTAAAGMSAPDRDQVRNGNYQAERRSVLLLVLLSIITLGIYPSVWFLRRRRFLDSLDSTQKLGGLAAAPLAGLIVSIVLGFVALPPELDRAGSVASGAASVITAFQVARILRSNFARSGRLLQVSRIATFFFNAFYLQYKINQAADTPPSQGRGAVVS
jgi:hypothetical protein